MRLDGSSHSKYKYSVNNALENTPLERLSFQQAQQYWIERVLQDAESNAGKADCQVCGWTAWHHHITMVLLAILFMRETRVNNAEAYDLLSTADIKEFLAHLLPKRKVTENEIFRQMEKRNKKRRNDIRNSRKT